MCSQQLEIAAVDVLDVLQANMKAPAFPILFYKVRG